MVNYNEKLTPEEYEKGYYVAGDKLEDLTKKFKELTEELKEKEEEIRKLKSQNKKEIVQAGILENKISVQTSGIYRLENEIRDINNSMSGRANAKLQIEIQQVQSNAKKLIESFVDIRREFLDTDIQKNLFGGVVADKTDSLFRLLYMAFYLRQNTPTTQYWLINICNTIIMDGAEEIVHMGPEYNKGSLKTASQMFSDKQIETITNQFQKSFGILDIDNENKTILKEMVQHIKTLQSLGRSAYGRN